MPRNIAILGATSNIAKGLVVRFDQSPDTELTLFARDARRTADFLAEQGCRPCSIFQDFEMLNRLRFDAVINCVAYHPSAGVHDFGTFETKECFDNLAITYLRHSESCRYVHFSSGAIYGGDFAHPVADGQHVMFPINRLSSLAYYQAVLLHSEAKHRSLYPLNIVDLRIFSYFSRFQSPDAPFLLSKIISCLLQRQEFVTDTVDIVRDYVHPDDLFRLIESCLLAEQINTAFDVSSKAPVRKFELLELFATEFGLQYRICDEKIENKETGIKPAYYSHGNASAGFTPKYTSAETVLSETKLLLADR